MKKFKLIAFGILLFIFSQICFGQNGVTFSEFLVKISPHFNNEMISDLQKFLPQTFRFTVWGWDVGDFSGDNNPDLSFVIKITQERKKIVYVYMFVDDDGFFELVQILPFEYYELPLEVGIVIKNNECQISHKQKDDDWQIYSYTFQNGVVILTSESSFVKNNDYFLERKINYITNQTQFKVNSLVSSFNFFADFLTVPSYPRGLNIFKGYPQLSTAQHSQYVIKGSYYWKGETDASFSVKSSFDANYLYFTFYVADDNVVSNCERCQKDKLTLWFDFDPVKSTNERLFKVAGRKLAIKSINTSKVYKLEIDLGNFYDITPSVSGFFSNEPLDEFQKKAMEKIRLSAQQTESGFILKIRLPFVLFGYETVPLDNDKSIFIGFSTVYQDVDNEFRPDEFTLLASSIFDEEQPSSYGEIILLPKPSSHYFVKNVYLDKILQLLEEYGF